MRHTTLALALAVCHGQRQLQCRSCRQHRSQIARTEGTTRSMSGQDCELEERTDAHPKSILIRHANGGHEERHAKVETKGA